MNSGVNAKKLVVIKGKITILDNLSFAVSPGKLTGLIGPSGSGKTTLMRTIVGLQSASSGVVTIAGMVAGSPQLRSQVGYVTQQPAVYEDITVRQNLEYFAVLQRAGSRAIDRVLELVDLQKQSNQLVSSLSGGQRARVSLAVALLGEPDVLVLDEPTVGLDPVLRLQLWDMFRRMADDGKTIIVSSHVMDEADRCDDVLLMRDGKLLWSDSRVGLLKNTHTSTIEEAFLKKVES